MIEMSCAPYVPSKPEIVQKMLEIAKVKPNDVVYDLGCGDGRILIKAVEDFKVKRAVGYELDKQRYTSTVKEILRRNLQDRIKIIYGNLFEADLSDATVLTLYLTSWGNDRLKPKLIKETSPGTRVVSHSFRMSEWRVIKEESVGYFRTIYLYVIPDSFSIKRNDWSTRIRKIFV
jgi:hypothetical protein